MSALNVQSAARASTGLRMGKGMIAETGTGSRRFQGVPGSKGSQWVLGSGFLRAQNGGPRGAEPRTRWNLEPPLEPLGTLGYSEAGGISTVPAGVHGPQRKIRFIAIAPAAGAIS